MVELILCRSGHNVYLTFRKEIRIINKDYPGSLIHVLELFKDNKINLTRIESNLLNLKNEYNYLQKVIKNVCLQFL